MDRRLRLLRRSECGASLCLLGALCLGTSDRSAFAAEPPHPSPAPPASADNALLKGTDLDGVLHRLGEKEGVRAVVVVFLSTDCPISNGCLPALNQLAARRDRAVEIYGVVSGPAASRAKACRHHKEYGLHFPVLFDASEELRCRLNPTHTPHAFVLTRDGSVAYHGAVDNRYASVGRKKVEATENHLQNAVAAVVAGRPVAVASTKPVGCLLEDPLDLTRSGSITFNRDIAPILFAQCVRCHREGQAAPFPLVTCEDASRHARQIVEVTKSRQMPPWKPVAGHGRFKDERRLTEREITLFSAWVEGGKPEGEAEDCPAVPEFSEGWQLGKPDLVLRVPQPFEVPSRGSDLHQHFVLPAHLADTRLVSAVEFKPGNPKVVHHACFYLDNTGAARKLDQADPRQGYGGPGGAGFVPQSTLRSWLPGFTARRLPEGSGRHMLKGSDLVLEIHYQSSGKPELDQSTVALYFAPKKAKRLVGELKILNYRLDIPAGEPRHHHVATFTLPTDTTLLDCAPHMHLLGREMKATATLPGGRIEPLIWVKDWHYQWQEQYEYLEPVKLPKGTRIDVEAWYDNSAGNPLNPFSPPQRVGWGEQTKEEMGICHFQYTCDSMSDFVEFSRQFDEYYAGQIRAAREWRPAGP